MLPRSAGKRRIGYPLVQVPAEPVPTRPATGRSSVRPASGGGLLQALAVSPWGEPLKKGLLHKGPWAPSAYIRAGASGGRSRADACVDASDIARDFTPLVVHRFEPFWWK